MANPDIWKYTRTLCYFSKEKSWAEKHQWPYFWPDPEVSQQYPTKKVTLADCVVEGKEQIRKTCFIIILSCERELHVKENYSGHLLSPDAELFLGSGCAGEKVAAYNHSAVFLLCFLKDYQVRIEMEK